MFLIPIPKDLILFGAFLISISIASGQAEIDIWYGDEQKFGTLGQAQRWLNVLGSVGVYSEGTNVFYRLNNDVDKELSLGSDQHRLAYPGDFNVELDWKELRKGINKLLIIKDASQGHRDTMSISLLVEKGNKWPLPYRVDFSQTDDLQSVVQIIDGKWKLTSTGVRTAEPFYDRVLSMGDTSWHNYEALIELTLHGWTPSEPGPPTYNVTHFGTALRWRGHHKDDRQPSRKWYPLGAQGEFLLKDTLDKCQWRILFDGGRKKPKKFGLAVKEIRPGRRMYIRASVQTLADGKTQYQFKQWLADNLEPDEWDVIGLEEDDYSSGALCLVPHNSDVTIHQVKVEPINKINIE